MRIIICGAGQVGWQIARHLSKEGNDITVIDNKPELISRITDVLDVNGVTGFASHPDVLEQAQARDADMVIAATFSDEVNMVTCQVAHSVFEVPRKIARLRSRSYLEAVYTDMYRREHMPIDVVISPEIEVAEAALRRLAAPAAFETESFLDGQAQLIGISLAEDCPVINTPLRQLSELFSTLNAIVVGVRRGKHLFVPESDDQLFAKDQVYLMSGTTDVARSLEIFGRSATRSDRVVIIGGGNVGLHIAKTLEESGGRTRARVIERSRARAEFAADALERTIVLNGDGLDSDLMAEANIQNAGALLAVTDDDKTNLLTCARAKAEGCPMVISLVNDPSLLSLLGPLGIDAYLNPRATTVSSILRHIRHGKVRQVYSIGDAEAELIEAQVLGTSPIAGQRIRDIDWPEGSLVGIIQKKSEVIRPHADTRLDEGDTLTVFVLSKDVSDIEKLFQVSVDYF